MTKRKYAKFSWTMDLPHDTFFTIARKNIPTFMQILLRDECEERIVPHINSAQTFRRIIADMRKSVKRLLIPASSFHSICKSSTFSRFL